MFNDSIDLPNIPQTFTYSNYTTIKHKITSTNSNNREADIENSIDILLKWAISLPVNNPRLKSEA
jgi:hypothetical protein